MKKRLKRDQEKAVVGGVLAGMAQYYDQDPILFRIAAIVFLIITGFFPGVLIYIVAWFIMPKTKTGETKYDYEATE